MNYTANDIISLSAGRAFREKIGMYLSADKQEAINLGLRELIVNVQDEYEVYKPKNPSLIISLNTKTKEIYVEDNMRGIPVGIRKDGINSLTAAFLIPHSGGKHREGVYSSAVGVNGEGNKIVCHTAEYLTVQVEREGKIYSQKFQSDEEGAKPISDVEIIGSTQQTGTKIWYKPDPKVYGDIFIDIEKLKSLLKEVSMFSCGLKIELFIDEKKIEEFYSEKGLIDGLNKNNRIFEPFTYHYETSDCIVDLALQWVDKKGDIRGYANNLYMPDGGAFISGFKTALTRTFNLLAGTSYDGNIIRNVIDGFVSVKVKMGQFTNQQKTALANPEARSATSTAITSALKEFEKKNPKEFKTIVDLIGKMRKAEQAAEKAKAAILRSNKDIENTVKRKVFASDKLKDARKLGQSATLYIVEGDSALNSMAQGRDVNSDGLLAIRGKIVNALSNPLDKVMENEEVKLICSALGVTPNNYKAGKLRYGRVVFATDADSDGSHICLLLLSLVNTLFPEMLNEHRIFRLDAPTHLVKTKTGKTFYYYGAEDFKKNHTAGDVVLLKGLGELSADQVRDSLFGKNQRLTPFNWTVDADILLNQLMGEDSDFRRDYLFEKVDFTTIAE